MVRERSQMTSSSKGERGLEKMTKDDGGGGCWAKDDVTFFIVISGENFKQFGFKKLVLLLEN